MDSYGLMALLALACFVVAAIAALVQRSWLGALIPAGLALWLLSTGAVFVSFHK